ncbi:hypothetical protein [Nisaea nitritireducens]|uniref:hypothetical protein n=1 Tax=Nisaea nitritireducens TaxID=568392 RepID=UPI00186954D4|nr:hypothetical protein [Nisaea nitritireducens]
MPLWPDTIPDEIGEDWAQLSDLLRDLDPNWSVWTEWYEDRLRGADDPRSRPLIEELEVERALIPDEEWDKGAAHVNALIAEIEAKYRERVSVDEQSEAGEDGVHQDPATSTPEVEERIGGSSGGGDADPEIDDSIDPYYGNSLQGIAKDEVSSKPTASKSAQPGLKIPRRNPSLKASATLWNEIRGRGNPQLVIRAVTIPPWKQTNKPFNLDEFLKHMEFENAVVIDEPGQVAVAAESTIRGWLAEAVQDSGYDLNPEDWHSRVFEDPWVSINRSPIKNLDLNWIIRNSDVFLKSSVKVALGIFIIGAAVCVVNVGWRATGPVGDAVGSKIGKWIDSDQTVEDTVQRVEEFAEQSDIVDI